MNLQFLGATGTVTGSKYLLASERHKVLVDCGLFQGYKNLRSRNWKPLPVAPSEIDAVLLTHAHLDHSGYLPLLVKNGFRGKILCTEATFDLCRIMLTDSGRLQEEEAAYANRHGYSKHAPALPLYSEADAIRALHYFSPVKFGETFALRGEMRATLVPAGHILGAAIALVDCGKTRITFSGDLGRQDDILMMPPTVVDQTDYLVVESTYGDRLHPGEDAGAKLAAVINETAERGGVTLIPSFAVGRAQALMYRIHLLK
ncbi:MAG TPA: MBL fold metallo-hydrolase, partial [Burkholderiaceae bacterium]